MCRRRLNALANVLHHWTLFNVCLNFYFLNTPLIHFITCQRVGTLKGEQLLEVEKPVSARNQLHQHWDWSQWTHILSIPRSCSKWTKTERWRLLAAVVLKCPWATFSFLPALRLLQPTLTSESLWKQGEIPLRDQWIITSLCINMLTGNCLDFICQHIYWPCANYTLFSLQLTAGLVFFK